MKHIGLFSLIPINDASWRKSWCVVLFTVVAWSAHAQQRADVLIVERPQVLMLLNQYQQQFTAADREALEPFTPFRILNDKDVLSDGITECVRAEVGGRLVFLLKDDGAIVGIGMAGRVQRLRDVRVLGDTLEVLSHRIVLQDPTRRSQRSAKPGDVFRRIIRDGRYVYVHAPHGGYGWLDLESAREGRDWVILKETKVSRNQHLRTALPRIQRNLEDTNLKLVMLFERLNRPGERRMRAPQWSLRETAAGLECVLDSMAQEFPETSHALAKTIEPLLFGTSLRVFVSPGRIEIR